MRLTMAKARMLHQKISTSRQVNRLSLPARLLFTWLIPHADDEGKLKGEADVIKAKVVPMTSWSLKRIEGWLEEIKNASLIYRWELNSEWFIEFVKWKDYQQLRSDRFKSSKLPSFPNKNDNQLSTDGQPDDNRVTTQSNVIESNPIESNAIEEKVNNEKSFENGMQKVERKLRELGLRN